MIEFTVYGLPQTKARPRVLRNGHCYSPSKKAEQTFSIDARSNCQFTSDMITLHPVFLFLMFGFQIPKSKAKKLKEGDYRASKPDIDNLEKFAMDAMNKIFFLDDKQVVGIFSKKVYVDEPRTEVRIIEEGEISPEMVSNFLKKARIIENLHSRLDS